MDGGFGHVGQLGLGGAECTAALQIAACLSKLAADNIMESLYLLIPLSVAIVFFALWVFFRAMDSGQFDDLEGPGMRILQDDDRVRDDVHPSKIDNKK